MKKRFLPRLTLLVWLLLPSIEAQASTSTNPCIGENFYHAKMDKEEVFSEFEGAVFRIWTTRRSESDPLTVGTAFLIDLQRGYALTAFHVVDAALNDAGISIQATSSKLPSQILRLRFVKHLAVPSDVAILQVIDPSSLITAHVRALDIAFHFLPKGSRYFTIGYPRGKQKPNDQEAELQGPDDNGHSLDVKQDVDQGSSGSPLIDEQGAALGVATDLLNKSEALYTPMVDLEDLFEGLSYDSVTKDLDLKVSGEPVARVRLELIQQLKWTSESPTNVELYEWARHISGNKSRYKSSRFYFSCPILAAYGDRRLGDSPIVQEMAGLFSRETQGAMLLDSADQNLLLGRVAVAEKLARGSLDIYSELNNQSGQATALMLIGRADLESGAYVDAVNYFRNALDKSRAAGDTRSEGTVYRALGELASRQGDYLRAVSYLRTSSKLCKAVNDEPCVSSANRELARLEAVRSPVGSTIAWLSDDKPLEREGFWGHLYPFARRKYVQMQIESIRDRLTDLDELTAANSKAIKDTDSRAQANIELASNKANEADQHAVDAGNKATIAQQTAQQATQRLQTVETVVGNIDQYKASNQTEIRFRAGQTMLSKNAKDAIDEIANTVRGQHGYIIEVQAFSSGRGQTAIANSQKMAESVVRYLVLNHEIPVYRIYMIGMGSVPDVAISDKGGKTKSVTSRRVEIKLLRTPQEPDQKDVSQP